MRAEIPKVYNNMDKQVMPNEGSPDKGGHAELAISVQGFVAIFILTMCSNQGFPLCCSLLTLYVKLGV